MLSANAPVPFTMRFRGMVGADVCRCGVCVFGVVCKCVVRVCVRCECVVYIWCMRDECMCVCTLEVHTLQKTNCCFSKQFGY